MTSASGGTPALRLTHFLYIDLRVFTAHNPLLRLVLTLPGRSSSGHSDGHPKGEIPAGFPARPIPGCVVEPMLKQGVWMLATIPAMVAGLDRLANAPYP